MKICFYTNRGLRRFHNEDAILIDNQLYSQKDFYYPELIELRNTSNLKFIIADGMGGHSKGEVASFLVLDYIRKQNILDEKQLKEILFNSKKVLNEYVKEYPEAKDLGTVLAGVIILQDRFIVFNIGDSRVYQKINHSLKRVSKDHSFVETLYSRGYIKYDEMRYHPEKHIVTSCLIGDQKKEMPEIFITTLEKKANERNFFLICSDGLWEMLSDAEMEEIIHRNQNLIQIANELKQKAFDNGAYDNISFILLEIE